MSVLSFSDGKKALGDSQQGEYLRKYLSDIHAKTVIIEEKYIDKDYLIDYCNFHARSFDESDKYTTRLHFFSEEFTQADFYKKFFVDEKFQDDLFKSYLGFVVVKPIGYNDNCKLIGRTILKTYETEIKDESTHKKEIRHFTTFEYSVSLYGFSLKVKSLPYQAQDKVVAACASTAIWTSLYALNRLFETPRQSPFEVTKTAVVSPGFDRNFPSTGLDVYQIKAYFNSIGLETESIYVANSRKQKLVPDIIKAFLNLNLPVIAYIDLEKSNSKNKNIHAVVITGYRCDENENITELYVHDDQIGPYSRVICPIKNKSFVYWENEWNKEWSDKTGYKRIHLTTLLIPLYPKIRLSFSKIYEAYSEIKSEHKRKNFVTTLSLIEQNEYKKELLYEEIENKPEILMKRMPKYNWLIRVKSNGLLFQDYVIDATSVLQPSFTQVVFKM